MMTNSERIRQAGRCAAAAALQAFRGAELARRPGHLVAAYDAARAAAAVAMANERDAIARELDDAAEAATVEDLLRAYDPAAAAALRDAYRRACHDVDAGLLRRQDAALLTGVRQAGAAAPDAAVAADWLRQAYPEQSEPPEPPEPPERTASRADALLTDPVSAPRDWRHGVRGIGILPELSDAGAIGAVRWYAARMAAAQERYSAQARLFATMQALVAAAESATCEGRPLDIEAMMRITGRSSPTLLARLITRALHDLDGLDSHQAAILRALHDEIIAPGGGEIRR